MLMVYNDYLNVLYKYYYNLLFCSIFFPQNNIHNENLFFIQTDLHVIAYYQTICSIKQKFRLY